MKLQKYLAHAGVCSRRKAEEYIEKGLVSVNDVKAHIGQIIDPEKDIVKVDDQVIKDQENLVYYIVNKPRGIVTTCLSGEEDTGILDIVDIPERVFPIGRLDKETTGLIILTNDGRLSNYLMHPRHEHEKEYVVEVYGKIEDDGIERMQKGVIIDVKDNGGRQRGTQGEHKQTYRTRPCEIRRLSSSKFTITLKEGKNRQIRRMVAVVGYDVKKLKRVRIENILLGDLPEGNFRKLTNLEKTKLLERIGENE
ncbi:rRNA pseudouridine synthase [Candidatus Gracilibacteria bacterium]|nr:rRNA pseudouridine synthase [Candidatus Gracilibacteria bacterium]